MLTTTTGSASGGLSSFDESHQRAVLQAIVAKGRSLEHYHGNIRHDHPEGYLSHAHHTRHLKIPSSWAGPPETRKASGQTHHHSGSPRGVSETQPTEAVISPETLLENGPR